MTLRNVFFILIFLIFSSTLYSSKIHFEIDELDKTDLYSILTFDEKEWIKKSDIITVGVVQNEPASFYTDSEDGYSIEILKMIGNATGLIFRFYDISKISDKDISMLDIVSVSGCDYRDSSFDDSDEYISLQYGIYTKKGNKIPSSIESFNGEKVGINKCMGIYKKYEGINFIDFDKPYDSVISVKKGETAAWLTDNIAGIYTLKRYNVHEMELVFSPKIYKKLSFGINKRNPRLLSIVNKALSLISFDTKEKIISHYSGVVVSKEKKILYLVFFLALIFAFSLIILIIYLFINNKRLKNDISRHEHNFKLLADTAYNWEYWTDRDGKMIFVSSSVEKITGYPAISFNDNPDFITRIIYPEDIDKFKDHVFNTHNSDSSRVAESMTIRFIHRNGTLKWIEHFCYPIYDERGVWIGRRSSNHDITEKVSAEEKVYESEENFRTVLDSIGEAIIVTDFSGIITLVNSYAEKLSGFSGNSILGKDIEKVFTILTSEKRAPISFTLKKLLNNSALSYSNDAVFVSGDGREIDIFYTVTSVNDRFGKKTGFIFAVKDITQNNEKNRALISWFKRLDAASLFMRFGLWEWDLVTNRVDVNESWLNVIEITEIKDKNYIEFWLDSLHPSDKDKVFEEFTSIKEGKRDFSRFECKTVLNNNIIWMSVAAKVTEKDHNDRPLKIVGFHQDITRRKESEFEIERLSEMIKNNIGNKNYLK